MIHICKQGYTMLITAFVVSLKFNLKMRIQTNLGAVEEEKQ